MRPSGYHDLQPVSLPWVRAYPSHWNRRRLRFLLRDGYQGLKIGPFGSQIKLQDLSDSGFKIYGQENVIGRDFTLGHRYLEPAAFEELRVYEVKAMDLVVTMMGTSGRCAIVPEDIPPGIMDSHLVRLRTRDEISNHYLRYLIDESPYIRTQVDLLGKGSIMQGLNSGIIKNLDLLLPPLDEQDAIAKFLDWKTGQIDVLMAQKQELLERLKEKRIAVITQAVTKGLNPDVPMRESGIPWLGQVPEHWEVIRLRFLVKAIDQGWSPRASNVAAGDGEFGVLKLSAVDCGEFHQEENKLLEEGPEDRAIQTPQKYDILVTRANTPELVGDACSISQNFPYLIIPDLIYRLKVDRIRSEGRFISYFLLSKPGRAQIEANARGSSGSMVKLGQGHLKDFQISSPSREEQEKIANYLDEQTIHIDLLMEKINGAIDRLIEYRTALITAATTGKIDLRGVKIPQSVS